MTMRIGITGASGTIGKELLKYPNFFPLVGDVRRHDERTPSEVEVAIKSEKPDLIVHLAFVSDVDYCEDRKNFAHVTSVNVNGTFNVASAAAENGCGMVFMSSDHVFDGIWGNYKEKNRPHPKNFYGLTKMSCEGFQKIFPELRIVRTSYLLTDERMDRELENIRAGHDYPNFMYRSFMPIKSFAQSFVQYCQRIEEMPSIVHISGSEIISWLDLARHIAKDLRLNPSTIYPRTKEIPSYTPRPNRGGLNVSLSKKLGLPQASYKDINW